MVDALCFASAVQAVCRRYDRSSLMVESIIIIISRFGVRVRRSFLLFRLLLFTQVVGVYLRTSCTRYNISLGVTFVLLGGLIQKGRSCMMIDSVCFVAPLVLNATCLRDERVGRGEGAGG